MFQSDEKARQAAGIAVLNKIESARIIPGTYVPARDIADIAVDAYLAALPSPVAARAVPEALEAVARALCVQAGEDRRKRMHREATPRIPS